MPIWSLASLVRCIYVYVGYSRSTPEYCQERNLNRGISTSQFKYFRFWLYSSIKERLPRILHGQSLLVSVKFPPDDIGGYINYVVLQYPGLSPWIIKASFFLGRVQSTSHLNLLSTSTILIQLHYYHENERPSRGPPSNPSRRECLPAHLP